MLVKSVAPSLFKQPRRLLVKYRKMSQFQETTVNINGTNINYLKVGQGPRNLMLLPGALGSIWSDFKPQVEGLDKSKFTIYAWDPPGYGKSRPPNKKFDLDFFENDAAAAVSLMKSVGANRFTPLGWSDGGITALIMAAKFKEHIDKLVVWGANAYVTQQDIGIYEGIRDTSKWSVKMREPLEALYGADGLQEMWSSWVDVLVKFLNERQGNICKSALPAITANTLVVHGDKDPVVPSEHPEYLIKNISKVRIHHFPEGKHNLHLRYAKEFNQLIEDFLDN